MTNVLRPRNSTHFLDARMNRGAVHYSRSEVHVVQARPLVVRGRESMRVHLSSEPMWRSEGHEFSLFCDSDRPDVTSFYNSMDGIRPARVFMCDIRLVITFLHLSTGDVTVPDIRYNPEMVRWKTWIGWADKTARRSGSVGQGVCVINRRSQHVTRPRSAHTQSEDIRPEQRDCWPLQLTGMGPQPTGMNPCHNTMPFVHNSVAVRGARSGNDRTSPTGEQDRGNSELQQLRVMDMVFSKHKFIKEKDFHEWTLLYTLACQADSHCVSRKVFFFNTHRSWSIRGRVW